MELDRRWWILGIIIVVSSMVIATQYAVTRVGYEYVIVHPSEANVRFIGSDNSSDDVRVLRVQGSNHTNVIVTLRLGNFAANMTATYSAAFGIVNEEKYPVHITHINLTSLNATYLKIWLHGNRTANADSNLTDPSTVYMYNNGTVVHPANSTAWILAKGDGNFSTMCSNISDRVNHSIRTPWDEPAHVRYSINNTNAESNVSDFVWVQVQLDIPFSPGDLGTHTGSIWIYFESDTY